MTVLADTRARPTAFVCENCGYADVGKYCSNCGTPNGKAASRLAAIKSIFGAPYEYAMLIVGVLRAATFARRIRSRQIGILNSLVFASIAVALVSLLRALFGVGTFAAVLTDASSPWLTEPVRAGLVELGAFLLAAFGFWLALCPTHLLLKQEGDAAARWSNMFVANTCIYAIVYPLFFLGVVPLIESDRTTALALTGAFNAIAGLLMLRIYKHLYGRSYGATVVSLLVFLAIVLAVAVVAGVVWLFLFPGLPPPL